MILDRTLDGTCQIKASRPGLATLIRLPFTPLIRQAVKEAAERAEEAKVAHEAVELKERAEREAKAEEMRRHNAAKTLQRGKKKGAAAVGDLATEQASVEALKEETAAAVAVADRKSVAAGEKAEELRRKRAAKTLQRVQKQRGGDTSVRPTPLWRWLAPPWPSAAPIAPTLVPAEEALADAADEPARAAVRAPPGAFAPLIVATSVKAQLSCFTRLTLCTPIAQRTVAPLPLRGKSGNARGSAPPRPR